MNKIISWITSELPSVLGTAAGSIFKYWQLIVALGLVAGTAFVTHRVDEVARLDLLNQYQRQQTAAVQAAKDLQKKQDDVALTTAVHEATAQQKIVTQTVTIRQEVPKYVTRTLTKHDSVACVSYGFVRVLDAAALGVDPADLPLPAGKSNDSCTALDPVALATAIADNYGITRQNAQQLDDLEDYVRQLETTLNSGDHP